MLEQKISYEVVSIFGAIISAGLAVLFYQSSTTISEYQRSTIRRLHQSVRTLDLEVKQDIFESRHGLTQQYDDLMLTVLALEQDVQRFEYAVKEAINPWPPVLTQAFLGLHAAVARKAALVERFVSRNAVLQTTIQNLPQALEELRVYTGGSKQSQSIGRDSYQLEALIYKHSLLSETEEINEFRYALKKFQVHYKESVLEQIDKKKVFEQVEKILLYGRIYMREVLAVRKYVSKIKDNSVANAVGEVGQQLAGYIKRIEADAGLFRVLMYAAIAFCLCLLGMMLAHFRRLYRELKYEASEQRQSKRKYQKYLTEINEIHQSIVGNVNSGLFLMNYQGCLEGGFSAAVLDWFGEPKQNDSVTKWLGFFDTEFSEYLEIGLESLNELMMPKELIISQFPMELSTKKQDFSVDYVFVDHQKPKILVIIEDISDSILSESLESRQSELMAFLQKANEDPLAAREFWSDTSSRLKELDDCSDLIEYKQDIHTIKGNSAIFGLHYFSKKCQVLEQLVVEKQQLPKQAELERVRSEWLRISKQITPFVDDKKDVIELSSGDVMYIQSAIRNHMPVDDVISVIDSWYMEKLEARFFRLRDYMYGLAQRLGKDIPNIKIDSVEIRFDSKYYRLFWSAITQVLRNVLEHGIETSQVRGSLGKPKRGVVRFYSQVVGENWVVGIADDGRGIDWTKLRQVADIRGMKVQSHQDLVDALFCSGVSTKDPTGAWVELGVGLNGVRNQLSTLGGRYQVESSQGEGTKFLFFLPINETVSVQMPIARSFRSQKV